MSKELSANRKTTDQVKRAKIASSSPRLRKIQVSNGSYAETNDSFDIGDTGGSYDTADERGDGFGVEDVNEENEANERTELCIVDKRKESGGCKKLKRSRGSGNDCKVSATRSDGVAYTVPQLRRRLAATVKKIGVCEEEVARLQEQVAALEKERRMLLSQNKIPSLEQAMRESSERASDPAVMRQFEMSNSESVYSGPEGDRKAMLAHRQRVQARMKELTKAKEEFMERTREQVISARNELLAIRGKAELALNTKKNDLKLVEARLREYQEERTLLTEAISAGRQGLCVLLRGGGSRGEALRRHAPSRRVEGKRSDGGVSRRVSYPIDDALLSDARAFTYHPSWLDVSMSSRKVKLVQIYETLQLLGCKVLGQKVPQCEQLEVLISTMSDPTGPSTWLRDLNYSLIRLLILDDVEREVGTARPYWSVLLSPGCWPEIVRRFILLRHTSEDTPDHQRPDQDVLEAANLLATNEIDSLTSDQYLVILHFLSDTVMADSNVFRAAVVKREQANAAKRKELKEMVTGSKGKAGDSQTREVGTQMVEKRDNRAPLGVDRYNRRYWWGLGCVNGGILIEDTHEFLALVSSEAELEQLLQSLDDRGSREHILRRNILAVKDSIIRTMKRKENVKEIVEVTGEAEARMQPLRQSSRQTRQAEFYDPTSATSKEYVKVVSHGIVKERGACHGPGDTSDVHYRSQLSILPQLSHSMMISTAETIHILVKLGEEMKRLGITCRAISPSVSTLSSLSSLSTWDRFEKTATSFGFCYGSEEYKGITAAHIIETHRSLLCFVEGVLCAKSRELQGLKDRRECIETKTVDISDLLAHVQRRPPSMSISLWSTTKDRASWLADVTESSISSSRLNYAARILRGQAMPLLNKLQCRA